jgi:hypothetical protein
VVRQRAGDGTAGKRTSLVTGWWTFLGMAVAIAGFMLATTWFRRGEHADLGSVSHQWIAEQRAGQPYDRQG